MYDTVVSFEDVMCGLSVKGLENAVNNLIDGKCVHVGVPVGSFDSEGVSNEQKAIAVEKGYIYGVLPFGVPRPFMKMTVDQVMNDIDIITSIWINQGARQAGKMIVEIMKDTMTFGEFAPLSEYTIDSRRMRGNLSKQPTVDTGDLRDSITYEVE